MNKWNCPMLKYDEILDDIFSLLSGGGFPSSEICHFRHAESGRCLVTTCDMWEELVKSEGPEPLKTTSGTSLSSVSPLALNRFFMNSLETYPHPDRPDPAFLSIRTYIKLQSGCHSPNLVMVKELLGPWGWRRTSQQMQQANGQTLV